MDKSKERTIILLLAALVIIIYAPSFQAPFLLDDKHMITDNLFIKSYKNIPMFFRGLVTNQPIPKGMCRPLLMLTFVFNYITSGLNPAGYHILNMLFHFLNVILFYFILKHLFLSIDNTEAAAAVIFPILVFLTHPINTETISYVSSRSDLMVVMFILGGFLLYCRGKTKASLACYAGALLTKETGLCFPIFIGAFDWTIHKTTLRRLIKNKWRIYLSLTIITIAYFIYKNTVFKADIVAPNRSYYANILAQAQITFLYLKLFVWPQGLNLFHSIPASQDMLTLKTALSLTAITLFIITALKTRKNRPLAALGIFWFLIGLLPKFYARLKFPAMEHHFYMAGLGLYMIISYAIYKFYPEFKYRRWPGILIISVLSLLTVLRNVEYRDSFIFWHITARRAPRSAAAPLTLGIKYLEKGLTEEAEKQFLKVLRLSKDEKHLAKAQINLAVVYRNQKKYEKARKIMEALTRVKKPLIGTWQNLGIIYFLMGDKQKAVSAWENEISAYPQNEGAYVNLGNYYLTNNNLKQAGKYFRNANKINPDMASPLFGLGKICEINGDTACAVSYYQKGLKTPQQEEKHKICYALGTIYLKQKNILGVNYLNKAIEIKPDFAPAYNDLAVFFSCINPPNWRLAQDLCRKARRLNYPVNEDFLKLLKEHNP